MVNSASRSTKKMISKTTTDASKPNKMASNNAKDTVRWLIPGRPLKDIFDCLTGTFRTEQIRQGSDLKSVDGHETMTSDESVPWKSLEHPRSIIDTISSSGIGEDRYVDAPACLTAKITPLAGQYISDPTLVDAASISTPLAASRLDLISYPEDGTWGDTGSALKLTKRFVWEAYTILRCEEEITDLENELQANLDELARLDDLVAETYHPPEALSEDEVQSKQLEVLEYANSIAGNLKLQEDDIMEKLHRKKEELSAPKEMFWQDLKQVFARHGFLRDPWAEPTTSSTPRNEGVHPEPRQENPITSTSPSPSEVAKAETEETRQRAHEMKNIAKSTYYDALDRVDNWHAYYNEEYEAYAAQYNSGAINTSKTDFDSILFMQEREAGQALIAAEADMRLANQHAREVGVYYANSEQESNFDDHPEDNAIMSIDPDWAQRIDRRLIDKWLAQEDKWSGLEYSEEKFQWPSYSAECDDWDYRDVDFGDSVSVTADGKARSKIDQYRSICEKAANEDR